MKCFIRSFLFICLLGLIFTESFSQTISFSITLEIDSLNGVLLKEPNNSTAHRALIKAYLATYNYELALLEITKLEADNKIDIALSKMKASCFFRLSKLEGAEQDFKFVYFNKPDDESLLYLAILNYAKGKNEIGLSILKSLQKRNPNLFEDLKKVLSSFDDNKKLAPKATVAAMKDIDITGFTRYFSLPVLNISSPANGEVLASPETEVKFTIEHNKPIRKIRLGVRNILNREGEDFTGRMVPAHLSYSEKVPINPGQNIIPIDITDIFGYNIKDTIKVFNPSFVKNPAFQSPLSDSLRKAIAYLTSYVPLVDIKSVNFPKFKSIAVSNLTDMKNNNISLFFYDLISFFNKERDMPLNFKFMDENFFNEVNLLLLVDNWTIKQGDKYLNLYMDGDWSVENGKLLFRCGVNECRVDELTNLLISGKFNRVNLIASGSYKNKDEIIRAFAARNYSDSNLSYVLIDSDVNATGEIISRLATFNHTSVMVVNDTSSQKADKFVRINAAPSPTISDSININSLSTIFSAYSTLGTGFITLNPFAIAFNKYEALVSQMPLKLKFAKATYSQQEKIAEFASNWRHYNEIDRYLTDRMTLEELVIRVDELNNRLKKGTKKDE